MFVSELVLEEVRRGDPLVAALRIAELDGISVLEVNEEARELASKFLGQGVLPLIAQEDALHVATATTQGLDYRQASRKSRRGTHECVRHVAA